MVSTTKQGRQSQRSTSKGRRWDVDNAPRARLQLAAGRAGNHAPSLAVHLHQRVVAEHALPVDGVSAEDIARDRVLVLSLLS